MDAFNSRLSLLNLGYSRDNEHWNYGPVCSSFSRFYLVTKGAAYVEMNGRRHKITPGHLYLIPELTTHWDISNGCFEHYYIHFIDPLHELMKLYQQYEMPFEVEATEQIAALVSRVCQEYKEYALKQSQPKVYDNLPDMMAMYRQFEKNDVGQKMRMNSLLQFLLSFFFIKAVRRDYVTDSRIASVIWYMEQHLEEEIRLDKLAQGVCLCKERLIRLFKEQTGMTPTKYIMTKRISRAETLLLTYQHSIKEIASMVGYHDQNYFCRCFKQVAGLTPMAFVKQNR